MNSTRRGAISLSIAAPPERIERMRSTKNTRNSFDGVMEAPPSAGRSAASAASNSVITIMVTSVR